MSVRRSFDADPAHSVRGQRPHGHQPHVSMRGVCVCVGWYSRPVCATTSRTSKPGTITRTPEREYISVPPQPSRYTSSEGAWGVNMQERRGVEKSVRCSFDDDTAPTVRGQRPHGHQPHVSMRIECACVRVGTHGLCAAQRHARHNQERSHAHDREGIIDKCTATAQQVHIQ